MDKQSTRYGINKISRQQNSLIPPSSRYTTSYNPSFNGQPVLPPSMRNNRPDISQRISPSIQMMQRRKINQPKHENQNEIDNRLNREYKDIVYPLVANRQLDNNMSIPFTSNHPIYNDRNINQTNIFQTNYHNPINQNIPRPRINTWGQTQPLNNNIYQMKMLQSIFEKTDSENVFCEKFSLSLPDEIQQAINEAKKKGFKLKRIDLGEVNIQIFILQNKIWIWNYQNEFSGFLDFDIHVSDIQLLKIMGGLLFFWVELDNQTANVIQVSNSEQELEDDPKKLEIIPLLLKQKSLFALTSKWVDYINGIIFVNSSKQVGTIVFEEDHAIVNIRLHNNPGTLKSGNLKRVKKAITNIFSWKKYYDFKIRILDDRVYILKTSFNSNKKGKIVELDDALNPKSNNLPNNLVKVRSQAVYNYCMTPRGRLISKGKLSLKKLFLANRIVLDSHFQASGGFDTSLRIVDIKINDMPKSELVERSINNTNISSFNFLTVTQQLGTELQKLCNSPNVLESCLVGISMILLLENGVEIEVFPYEGLIKRIETLIILQEQESNFIYLGYLENREIILKQNEDLYMMTR